MEKAERKRTSLLANIGDLNRPLRVRPVRSLGYEWWAIDADDTWPGMVMDLRRLGFESIAVGDEVLVRESGPALDMHMEGMNDTNGLKPFPTINSTIRVRKDSYSTDYSDLMYLDDYKDEEDEEEDDLEPEDLDNE